MTFGFTWPPVSARLPWDHLDIGLEPDFLVKEYRKALKDRLSPPCGKPFKRLLHPNNVGDAEAAALADGEMDDAVMAAEHTAVEIDDVAGLGGAGPQPLDHFGVAAGRHEADVLAVLLVGDLEAKAPRQFARLRLAHLAEREAQIIELLARGREQEIALVAIGVGGANQRARSIAQAARSYIMSGRKR